MEVMVTPDSEMADVVKAIQDSGIGDVVAEREVPPPPAIMDLKGIQNASVNGERPHMDSLRLPAVAQSLNLVLSSPNEVEGVVCEEMTITDITDEHIDLTKRMLKLLAEINGLGLAAPQIGLKKRFMVYWDTRQNMPYVCYNPKYYPSRHMVNWAEKCLTYGDLTFAVQRYKEVQAVWWEYDPDKKELVKMSKNLKGLQGEVFQHETDHLNGITISRGVLLR